MGKPTHVIAADAKQMMNKYSKASMALSLATFLQYNSFNIGTILREMLDQNPKITKEQLQFVIDNPDEEDES